MEVFPVKKKSATVKRKPFVLTYATMFDPPEELHTRFERRLARLNREMGQEHPMLIGGVEVRSRAKFEDRSPINKDWRLGTFQKGDASHAARALIAARKASVSWSHTPWPQRVRLLRKAAKQIDQRIYEIAAVLSLEVGKNRMESLGDIAETADLVRYA